VKGLEGIGHGADVETVLEEVVAARRAGTGPKELFGGPRDWIDGAVPPIAFVIGNAIAGLGPAIYVALAAEAVIVAIRLARRETLRHAFSGAMGVAISALIAWKTGSAKNFFLPGIVINAAYAVGFVLSVVFRHPIVGVIMRLVMERPKEWHDHPTVRRAYAEATLGWAALFAVRVVVQETLRRLDQTGWLAVSKLAMGWPLYLAALALTVPYVKWRAREVPVPEPVPDSALDEEEAEPGGEDAEQDAP
jgi:intracellular septation protein A